MAERTPLNRQTLFGESAFWRTLRFRFAVWVSLLLLLVLIAFSFFLYRNLQERLTGALDDSLRLNALQVADVVDIEEGLPQFDDDAEGDNGTLTTIQNRNMTVRVLNMQGDAIYAAGRYRLIDTPTGVLSAALNREDTFTNLRDPFDDDDWIRLYTMPLLEDGDVIGFVETAQTLDAIEEPLERLSTALQFGIPAFILLIGLSGYWLAARALAPIDRITETARRISAHDLSTRLDLPATNDEVGRLAATFDMMLSRLEDAFHREKQFTSDASHELRTPLATIRTIHEMTRSRRRSPEDYEQALDDIYAETHRLQNLIENLLALARGEQTDLHDVEPINLSHLLHDVTETLRPFADEKGLILHSAAEPELYISGSYEMLMRLFLNLIDNAIKYTDHGEVAIIGQHETPHRIAITIADTGCGIPPEHLPYIFNRFYRADTSRSSPGTGLGLTIAMQIARVHHGDIQLKSDSHGTIALVTLPSLHG